MANFSSRIRELRLELGKTQQDMADIFSVRVRTYQCYEYGQSYPNVTSLIAIADFFGVSVDYLLGLSDVRERQ